jgi:hypothetical protein
MKTLTGFMALALAFVLAGCGGSLGTYTSTTRTPDAEVTAVRGPFGGTTDNNTADPYKACLDRLQGYIPKAPTDPRYSMYLFQIESICHDRSMYGGIGSMYGGIGPGMGDPRRIAIMGGNEGQVAYEQYGAQPTIVMNGQGGNVATKKDIEDLAAWMKAIQCQVKGGCTNKK